MKKIVLLVVFALFLTACGQSEEPNQPLTAEDINLPDTFNEETAVASYKKVCEVCHGADLQGAGAHPYPITGISKEEVYISIVQGIGLMPGNMVTGEEAENLAVWIAAQ